MDESKSEGGKVLDEPKWVLEGSEEGCFSLWKITRNSTGNEFEEFAAEVELRFHGGRIAVELVVRRLSERTSRKTESSESQED